LAYYAKPFDQSVLCSEVATYFRSNEEEQGVVITSQDQPVGLIMREQLFQHLAGQYGISLYWNKPIEQLMDRTPLIVNAGTPFERVSQLAMARERAKLYDLVIVIRDKKYAGVVSIQSILECSTQMQMEHARVASPLTGLPGNIQIQREMKERISRSAPFHVIYIDLDYFKWFNDCYGFQKGDDLIQYTAGLIEHAVNVLGGPHDFVGHIGGDDFIIMTSVEQPERICHEIIERFDQGVPSFYEGQACWVEDRCGNAVDMQGVTVSLSVVSCGGDAACTSEQVSQFAATLKKQAKAHRGSIYVKGSLATAVNPKVG